MVTADYTVRLERTFQGPMDLLLHLVREQEVDIHEIVIHRVIDDYLEYLKALEEIDIEIAGEFTVMAATLMAIKSRSLLPSEEVDLEEELDPRDELIQRLIEYRHFKEASRDLEDRRTERTRMYPPGWRPTGDEEPEELLDLGDITQWDLLGAFSRLMRETMAGRSMKIAADDRPLRFYVNRLVGWIKTTKRLSLRQIVRQTAEDPALSKPALIGTFCALLELMKLGAVTAVQPEAHGDIEVILNEDTEQDVDEIVRMSGFDDETPVAVDLGSPADGGETSGDAAASNDGEAPSAAPPESESAG